MNGKTWATYAKARGEAAARAPIARSADNPHDGNGRDDNGYHSPTRSRSGATRSKVLVVGARGLYREILGALLAAHGDFEVVGPADSAPAATAMIERRSRGTALIIQEAASDAASEDGAQTVREVRKNWPEARVIGVLVDRAHLSQRMMTDAGAAACVSIGDPFQSLVDVIDAHTDDSTPSRAARAQRDTTGPARSASSGNGTHASPFNGVFDRLSKREFEVFRLVAEGYGLAEMSVQLSLSPKTVDSHRRRAMEKLNLANLAELTRLAVREGLIEP